MWHSLIEQRSDLALYFGQDLVRSGELTQSEVKALFETRSFDTWRKSREHRDKTMAAVVKGINNLIKGLGIVGKMIAFALRR